MKDFTALANRLARNARHWGKWARRRGITCYRIYDRDIPEFPLALDLYEGRAHLQEYARHGDAADEGWIDEAARVVSQALAVAPEAVAVKRRLRQKGLAQYEKTGRRGEDFVVTEGGHRFVVNLDAYLDTGLFLDHRNTRRTVEERARGRRFLNLFCYTASFTVYAAAGGAVESESVDLSNTYLDWAARNFELNGLDAARHRLVRADARRYLEEAVAAGRRYDLIVLDPPSFSNSKAMQGVLDVQRDHAALIARCMEALDPGGELFFSTNLRSFKLDEAALSRWPWKELTPASIPEDFRNRRIHRCWVFRDSPK